MRKGILLCLSLLSACLDNFVVLGFSEYMRGLGRHLQTPDDKVVGKDKGVATKSPIIPASPSAAPTKFPVFFPVTAPPSRAPTSNEVTTSTPSKLPQVRPTSSPQNDPTKEPSPISQPQEIEPTPGPTPELNRKEPTRAPVSERNTIEPTLAPTSERHSISLAPFFLQVVASEILDRHSVRNATQTYFQENMIFPNIESVLLEKRLRRGRRSATELEHTFEYTGRAIFSGIPPEKDIVVGEQAALLQNSMVLQDSLRKDPNIPDTITVTNAGFLADDYSEGDKGMSGAQSSSSESHSNSATAAMIGVSACVVVICCTVGLFYCRLRRVRWQKSVSDLIGSGPVDGDGNDGRTPSSTESVPKDIQDIEIHFDPQKENQG